MAKGTSSKNSEQDKQKTGKFKVTFRVVPTSESFTATGVTVNTTVAKLKDIAELLTGIPTNIQRIHYLDAGIIFYAVIVTFSSTVFFMAKHDLI